jgi:hypothetical protein
MSHVLCDIYVDDCVLVWLLFVPVLLPVLMSMSTVNFCLQVCCQGRLQYAQPADSPRQESR